MTALSDIKNLADLINFVWERDKDHDWSLTKDEAADIDRETFARIDSDKDGTILGKELSAYRNLPVTNPYFRRQDFLLTADVKLGGTWFKGGHSWSTDDKGYSGTLAQDIEVSGHVYKAGTEVNVAFEPSSSEPARVTTSEGSPSLLNDGMLLEDSVLTRDHKIVSASSGIPSNEVEINLPQGTWVYRNDSNTVTQIKFDPKSNVPFQPLGGRFKTAVSQVFYKDDGTKEVVITENIKIPVKRIFDRVTNAVPLPLTSLIGFIPDASKYIHSVNHIIEKKLSNGMVMSSPAPVSPRDLVTQLLDSGVQDISTHPLLITYDQSGKPIKVRFQIHSSDPALDGIVVYDVPVPVIMPYLDRVLRIIDEELALANPNEEQKDEPVVLPIVAVRKYKNDDEPWFPNVRIEPSYQYLFGTGKRTAVEIEGGYKAFGIGFETSHTSPSGDNTALNEWRANASYRWKPIPGLLGAAIVMGGRSRNDGANGEQRTGMELGSKLSFVLTQSFMLYLTPSYAVVPGSNILDAASNISYRRGNFGTSLGYRGTLTNGTKSHGPQAGLFLWF